MSTDPQFPPGDRLFALIASIPGSGTIDWCGPARALLDEIAADSSEAHRLALSAALGLDPSAPWDAIRERAAELAGQPVAVDRGDAYQYAADAIERMQGYPRLVLPEEIVGELRRLAAETPGPQTQPILHAPGTAILCPDCHAKGHSVCMAGGEQQAETQAPAEIECANCWRVVENRSTPNMGGPSRDNWVHVPGGFQPCFPQRGVDSPRAEPELTVVPQPEIVHACPPDGSGLTPCCGRTPFELPLTDRISSEAPVTCTAPAVVAEPGKEDDAARIVAYRSDSGRLIHCLQHVPPPAARHADFHPVTSEDLPDGGICTHPECSVDVLAQQPKEA